MTTQMKPHKCTKEMFLEYISLKSSNNQSMREKDAFKVIITRDWVADKNL